jgi:hypothetical protein
LQENRIMTVTVRFARRSFLTAALLLPAFASFLGSDADAATLEEIKARGYMIVATEDDYKPFEFMEDGKPVGFDNELLEEVRKFVPFEIRQEVIPWTGLLAGVSTGKYDVAVTAAMITKERVKSLDFSMPIADSTHYYVKRKDDDSIKEIKDLSGKTVGVQSGSAQLEKLPELEAMLVASGGTQAARFRDQHDHQSALARGRQARHIRGRLCRLRTDGSGLGRRQGQYRASRGHQRLPCRAEEEREPRQASGEMARPGIPGPAGYVHALIMEAGPRPDMRPAIPEP